MKIAIIGNGVVGATCAYYLSQQKDIDIDLYDDNTLSGTQAAVGIVCPWVNQRRNNDWYRLVEEVANFYTQLTNDLDDESFITKSGAIIIHETKHDVLFDIAKQRLIDNPIMISVREVTQSSRMPSNFKFNKGIEVDGAFKVDGKKFLKSLNSKTINVNRINKTVDIKDVLDMNYDKVIVAAGGRTKELLNPLHLKCDLNSQKGMLLTFAYPKNNFRIIMPQGEIDFLFDRHELIIGASHENQFTHLEFDQTIANDLIAQAQKYMPLPNTDYGFRVGLRSHNSKNMPFFGALEKYPNLYVVGGLGSSGLTSGPLIGYKIANHIIKGTILDEVYSANNFIQ